MFTDVEVMMANRYHREMGIVVRQAQSIIDHKAAGIDAAHNEIRHLRRLLADETAKRQAAEFKVDRLKALARSLA